MDAKKGSKSAKKKTGNSTENIALPPKRRTVEVDAKPCTSHQPVSISSDFALIKQSDEKCSNILRNDRLSNKTRTLLEGFKLKVNIPSNVKDDKSLKENLRYFLRTMFVACPSMQINLSALTFLCKGISLKMQMQGSTNLCGLCALNNTLAQSSNIQPQAINRIADTTWLQQAMHQELTNDLEKFRSVSGDYNIDVLLNAALDAGFEHSTLNNALRSFFKDANPDYLASEADKMYSSLMSSLGVKPGDRLLLNNAADNFLALLFLEKDLLLLDSLDGPLLYSALDAVTYLWQLVYNSMMAIYKFSPKYVVIEEDSETAFKSKRTASVYYILKPDSPVDDCEEISNNFSHVTAGDVRCLSDSNHINDAVVAAVCQAINSRHSDVLAVDPLATAKLLKTPISANLNRGTRMINLGYKKILFPVNQDNHWWVASINLSSGTYSVLDSLAINRQHEVSSLVAALSYNGYSNAANFSLKHLDVPQQGSNTFQCGVLTICSLVSQAADQLPNFSIFDMDHVREQVARIIVEGDERELADSSLWEG